MHKKEGFILKFYSVRDAFEILKENKITSNIESVRRWLRQGKIKGIAPKSRKEGWQIPENELQIFMKKRLPESHTMTPHVINTTIVVNEEVKEKIRAEMWNELARKNIFEGFVQIKKSLLHECILHKRYSNELENEVWERIVNNSRAYSKPRVSYLLEAFRFEGKRLLMDKNYVTLEEQIIFGIIEYVRRNRDKKT